MFITWGFFLLQKNDISIAPNPVLNFLKVSLKEGVLNKIIIYNLNGKVVYSKKSNQNKMTINFENKTQGIYFLKTISDIGTAAKKVIKI